MNNLAQAHINSDKKYFYVEKNLLKNSYFSFNPYKKKEISEKNMIRRIEKIKIVENKKIKSIWKISGNVSYGMPSNFDYIVFDSLLKFIYEKYNFPIPEIIEFKIINIINNLNENKSGRLYSDIKESLQRMQATVINSQSSWYNKTLEKYEDISFSLISEIHFRGERNNNNEIIESDYLVFNKYFLDNLNNSYYFFFDITDRNKLFSPLAKRTFEMLTYYFFLYNQNTDKINPFIIFNYTKIIYEWYFMKEEKYISRIKKQLGKHYNELLKSHILDSYDIVKEEENIKIKFQVGNIISNNHLKKLETSKQIKEIKKHTDISDIRIISLLRKYGFDATLRFAQRKMNLNLTESLEELLGKSAK